jgi:hypothetical protein
MCPGAEDALLQAPEVADLWVSIFLVWMSTWNAGLKLLWVCSRSPGSFLGNGRHTCSCPQLTIPHHMCTWEHLNPVQATCPWGNFRGLAPDLSCFSNFQCEDLYPLLQLSKCRQTPLSSWVPQINRVLCIRTCPSSTITKQWESWGVRLLHYASYSFPFAFPSQWVPCEAKVRRKPILLVSWFPILPAF